MWKLGDWNVKYGKNVAIDREEVCDGDDDDGCLHAFGKETVLSFWVE